MRSNNTTVSEAQVHPAPVKVASNNTKTSEAQKSCPSNTTDAEDKTVCPGKAYADAQIASNKSTTTVAQTHEPKEGEKKEKTEEEKKAELEKIKADLDDQKKKAEEKANREKKQDNIKKIND